MHSFKVNAFSFVLISIRQTCSLHEFHIPFLIRVTSLFWVSHVFSLASFHGSCPKHCDDWLVGTCTGSIGIDFIDFCYYWLIPIMCKTTNVWKVFRCVNMTVSNPYFDKHNYEHDYKRETVASSAIFLHLLRWCLKTFLFVHYYLVMKIKN